MNRSLQGDKLKVGEKEFMKERAADIYAIDSNTQDSENKSL